MADITFSWWYGQGSVPDPPNTNPDDDPGFTRDPGFSDTTPPVIDDFDPPVGTPLERSDSVSFTVTDLYPGLRRVIVMVAYGGESYVIHDGDGFQGRFSNYSTRAELVVDESYRYTVRPNGGWTSAPRFKVAAIDEAGNETEG